MPGNYYGNVFFSKTVCGIFLKKHFRENFRKKFQKNYGKFFLEFPECHFIDTGNGMGNSEKQGLPAA